MLAILNISYGEHRHSSSEPSRSGQSSASCSQAALSAARYPRIRCARLADADLRADRTDRGNPVRREMLGDHLSRPFLQGVAIVPIPGVQPAGT
jgi:hypothetical protein